MAHKFGDAVTMGSLTRIPHPASRITHLVSGHTPFVPFAGWRQLPSFGQLKIDI